MEIRIKKMLRLLMIILLILSMASCSVSRKKIDIKDYVTVEYTSFEGHAEAKLKIDSEKLDEDIGIENLKKYFAKLNPDEARLYNTYGDYPEAREIFTIRLKEEYKNLSNGNTVVVEIVPGDLMEEKGKKISDCEKGLGIKFKKTTIEYKVEGLEKATEVDIFQNITKCIDFSGADGYAKGNVCIPDDFSIEVNGIYFTKYSSSSFQIIYNNQYVGRIYLGIKNSDEKKTAFGNGDTAVVYVDESSSEYSKLGTVCKAVLKSKSVNVTINGLGKLVTNKSELDSKILEEIKNANSKENSTLIGIYACTAKPTTVLNNSSPFKVIAIVKTPGFFYTNYREESYGDIIINSDGSWTCNGQNSTKAYDSSLWSFDESNPTAALDNGYNYEKIG